MVTQTEKKRLLPMGSCRGEDRKREILDYYYLVEVFHGIALSDTIRGCCQESALQEYHRFKFQKRAILDQNSSLPETGDMYVGTHCANEFQTIISELGESRPLPPFFNPLATSSAFITSQQPGKPPTQSINTMKPLTADLLAALTLMLSVFPSVGKNRQFLWQQYCRIMKNPHAIVFNQAVKGVNTAIGHYLSHGNGKKTLLDVAHERATEKGLTLRHFELQTLNRRLKQLNQSNHIC